MKRLLALGALVLFVAAMVVWTVPAGAASAKDPCARYKHNKHAYTLCKKRHH